MKKLVLFLVMLGVCIVPSLANAQDIPLEDHLLRAAIWEDAEEVHSLLGLGVSVNTYYSLYTVVKDGKSAKSLDIIRDLLDHGTDISKSRVQIRSILHTATYNAIAASHRTHGKLNPNNLAVQKWKLLLDWAVKKNVLYKDKELLEISLYSGVYTMDIINTLLNYGVEVRKKDVNLAEKYANLYPQSANMKEIVVRLKQVYHLQHQQRKQTLKEEFKRAWLSVLQDQNLWKY